jgi:hypothetical protein
MQESNGVPQVLPESIHVLPPAGSRKDAAAWRVVQIDANHHLSSRWVPSDELSRPESGQ